jgi:hypothetical protein
MVANPELTLADSGSIPAHPVPALPVKRPVHPTAPQAAENTPQKDPANFAGYFSRPATLFLVGC